MSENRFLYQFCSLLGAATLVCGTHLFLLATWNWDSATEVVPATPAATIPSELSAPSKPAEPVAELEIAPQPVSVEATEEQVQVALEDRPPSTAEARVGDQTPPASASANVSVDQPPITAEARAGNQTPPAPGSANVSVTLEEQSHVTAEARVGDQIHPAPASANVSVEQPSITSEARVGDQTPPASASANVSVTLEQQPRISAEAPVGGQTLPVSANANTSVEPATKDNMTDSASAPELQPSSSGETDEQGTEGGDRSDTTPIHHDAAVPRGKSRISQPHLPASLQQKAEAAERQQRELPDNSSVAQETNSFLSDAMQPQGSEQADETGSIATTVPNPRQSSLKARKGTKPSTAQTRPKLAANPKPAPKLVAKAAQHEQTSRVRSSQITSHWKPMALAPAEKPPLSLTQTRPKKPDARGYSASIWSALAHKKPNAGQRGSTTVTFAIGPAGALRFVRVIKSSGKARLDQLALETVRAAAPFSPPPVLNDETAAYTIRIDFH